MLPSLCVPLPHPTTPPLPSPPLPTTPSFYRTVHTAQEYEATVMSKADIYMNNLKHIIRELFAVNKNWPYTIPALKNQKCFLFFILKPTTLF